MHYFSIHTQQGGHLGFLIMLPDDEAAADSGRFAFKLQSETEPLPEAQALAPYQAADGSLNWHVNGDHVLLLEQQTTIGRIRNEYLSIGGQTLLLNDLTGSV